MTFIGDIYFLNAAALAHELRAGTLTQHRAIKHLVVIGILGGTAFQIPVSPEFKEANVEYLWSMLSGLGMFVISGFINYYGIWLLHQVNEKGDGKDFFLRFSILSLPVGLQVVLIFLPIGLVLIVLIALFTTALSSGIQLLSAVLFMAAACAFQIIYYLKMRTVFTIAAGTGE